MNIRPVSVDRLSRDEIAAWSNIQRANPLLDSPYFRPEFTLAVAAVRDDVEVAVLEQGGRSVGFFPYQRTPWNSGRPVGGRLSDFQAVIAPADVTWEPLDLLRSCRLWAWHFDHLLTAQHSFGPHMWRHDDSPFISVADSFNGCHAAHASRRRAANEHGQKRRKIEREIGPVRFVAHVTDRAVLSKLIEWKGAQFYRTGLRNIFEFAWVRDLLDKMLEYDGEDFAPMLSAVYAGDVLAAIHFGMRASGVLHSWFPAYNHELARYSPGVLQFLEMMDAAPSLGIRRIDLGKGPELFKRRLMTGAACVAEGTVDLHPATAVVRRVWRTTREHVRSSRFYAPVRVPARMIYKLRSRLELR
ncbi:MAG: GNAT family N-acetyltransferase [Planctomycetia bacterium]|nr:GNAT family N-acetyltransferase [Planctomycetia bacterium]